MKQQAQSNKTDARRLVEASAWMAHLTEHGERDTPEFRAWLEAEEGNRRAWQSVRESWDLFGDQAAAPEVLDLRRKALSQARAEGTQRWRGGVLGRSWQKRAIAAGFAAVAVVAWVVWQMQPDVYRTTAGERRAVALTDGSQVQLDALTVLRVSYSKRARDLVLVKGQARFDVARDVERPFTVLAGEKKVIALGTAFNVDLIGPQLLVTLIEGKVVVLPHDRSAQGSLLDVKTEAADKPVELAPGEQLTVATGAAPRVVKANVQRTTAWQSGQLIFDDEPLSAVIPRINRYAIKPLSVSEDAAALRLSGVFNAGDVNGFVATVAHYLPVEAVEEERVIRLRRALLP